MAFRPCAIIPSHNHRAAIGGIVAALRAQDLAVYVIDDGSAEPARSALAALHDPEDGVRVYRLAENPGRVPPSVMAFAWPRPPATAMPCRSMPTASTISMNVQTLLDRARANPSSAGDGRAHL